MGGAMQQPPTSRLCALYWPSKRGEHSASPAPNLFKSFDVSGALQRRSLCPESGHSFAPQRTPLWARSGLTHCNKRVAETVAFAGSSRSPDCLKRV
jgi:hypothetical protein